MLKPTKKNYSNIFLKFFLSNHQYCKSWYENKTSLFEERAC